MASSGNFCTLNPLVGVGTSTGRVNIGDMSLGNLKYEDSGSTGDAFVGNMAMTGKTYCEVRIDSIGNYGGTIGLRSTGAYAQTYDSVTFQTNYSSGLLYHYKGTSDQSASGNVGGTVSAGNIVMFAYDPATYKWWVGVNGTWRNSGDPANGSGEIFTGSATMFINMDITWGGWVGDVNGLDTTWNFGQDSTFGGVETAGGNADDNGFGDFKYSPPTGFLALCSGNLSISDDIDPAQTDDDYPQKQFNAVAYTGTGSARTVSGFGFQPDMVWIKNRASPGDQAHRIVDSSRGVSKAMIPEDTQVENTETTAIQAFNSDGFTIGSALGGYNTSSATYIVWGWKANGGTTVSNSSGSITSTVQANTKAGFSIVTYAGNDGSWGSGNRDTFGHGLSEAPEYIIIKERNATDAWTVFHAHVGNGGGSNAAANNLRLDTNDALYTNQSYKSFGETMPTSTLVTVEGNTTNSSGSNHIAYCWHSVEGYSKFGSYEGNGNNDGPFIYLGFRPRYWFFKEIDAADDWVAYDTARDTANTGSSKVLRYDVSNAEFDGATRAVDVLSNGLKIRTSNGTINTSGSTYIYGAWGDVPFKYNNTL